MNSIHSDSTGDYIFTAFITLRNGKRLYAKQVGKKAFVFPVNNKPKE